MCEKTRLEVRINWYEHKAESVIENKLAKFPWHAMLQCSRTVQLGSSDLAVIEKEAREFKSIEIMET